MNKKKQPKMTMSFEAIFNDTLLIVSDYFKVSPDDLVKRSVSKNITDARHAFRYLLSRKIPLQVLEERLEVNRTTFYASINYCKVCRLRKDDFSVKVSKLCFGDEIKKEFYSIYIYENEEGYCFLDPLLTTGKTTKKILNISLPATKGSVKLDSIVKYMENNFIISE